MNALDVLNGLNIYVSQAPPDKKLIVAAHRREQVHWACHFATKDNNGVGNRLLIQKIGTSVTCPDLDGLIDKDTSYPYL